MKHIHKEGLEGDYLAAWVDERRVELRPLSGKDRFLLLKNARDRTWKRLQTDLLREQGYLCAYCNQRIQNVPRQHDRDDYISVEHLVPKEKRADLSLDYRNLVAVCNGGEKRPKTGNERELYCGAAKKNEEISPKLFPTNPGCEELLAFNFTGRVALREGHEELENGLRLLNLNAEVLVKARAAVFETIIEELDSLEDSQVEFLNALETEHKQKDDSGKYPEFAGAVLSFIQNHFHA